MIKKFEQFNSEITVGPVQLQDIELKDGVYYLKTPEGTFKFNEGDDVGINNIPTKGYNYVFEVIEDRIQRVIFYVVDLIIIAEDKVLLIKRKNEPFANHWANPGGFVDAGEKPIDAAVRELEEETGLKLDESQLVFVGEYNKPWRDPRNKYSTSFAYMAKLDSIENVTAMDDALEAEWIPLSEIGNLELAFDHKEIINDSLNF